MKEIGLKHIGNNIQSIQNPMNQSVVDKKDNALFAVFVFNAWGQLMLQQRSPRKSDEPCLWSLTCSGSVTPGNNPHYLAYDRLKNEMGLSISFANEFKVEFNKHGLNNNEGNKLINCFIAYTGQLPSINQQDVIAYKFVTVKELKDDIKFNPNKYTTLLKLLIIELDKHFPSLNNNN